MQKPIALAASLGRRQLRKQFWASSARARFHTAWTQIGPQPPAPVCILAVRSPGRAAWRPFWFLGMYSQRRRCRLVGDKLKFSAQSGITGFDPYTANLDHAHGQDPKRSPATTEPFPLEAHSLLPALRARRMDRPGRPQGDNDIVEQYSNPSKELSLPRAP